MKKLHNYLSQLKLTISSLSQWIEEDEKDIDAENEGIFWTYIELLLA